MNPYATYPQPPYDAVMPAMSQAVFTFIYAIIAIGFWVHAWNIKKNQGDSMPILVMFGGTLCVFAEPIVDILGSCWFPVEGQWVMIETFGRKIPVMVGLAYMFYYGGFTYLTAQKMQKGMSYQQIWKWFGFMVLAEWAIEPIPINLGLWTYYGNQPFTLFNFPMWWPPVNAVASLVPALMIFKLRPHVSGIASLIFIPVVVSGDLTGNALTAWPLWNALHTNQGYGVTYLAGTATLILCAVTVHVIAKMASSNSEEYARAETAQ